MTNLSFNRKKIFGLEEDRVISFIQIKRSFFIFVIYFKFLKNVFERTDFLRNGLQIDEQRNAVKKVSDIMAAILFYSERIVSAS